MNYETVIGLEVHVELATKTKIFCSCTTEFGGVPNTHCCEICTGMPGTLPVLNRRVVEYAARAGLALHCTVTPRIKFDRKNYFYPDLPKAYQISQLYLPLCRDGFLEIETDDGSSKRIGIHEIHMEEDAGKLLHDPENAVSLVDYNRSGVPLIEIVSEPDFRTAHEVISYLERLKAILQFTGVSDCKMQEGSLRADINLSVRPVGQTTLGTRTEMKNMGSFKAIARAIRSESQRQIALLESGQAVIQETRRWDEKKEISLSMRSKENATDYRYFPEPDLPPVVLSEEWIESIRTSLPELPEAKKQRYRTEYSLSAADADGIVSSRCLVDLFEQTRQICGNAKEAANWIMVDVLALLSERGITPEEMDFPPDSLGKLIVLVQKGVVNRNTAKEVLAAIFLTSIDPEEYIRTHGLQMVRDDGAVRTAIATVLQENIRSVTEYRSGKEKAFQFLMGQSMRALRGKADPQSVTSILHELLDS